MELPDSEGRDAARVYALMWFAALRGASGDAVEALPVELDLLAREFFTRYKPLAKA